MPVIISVLFSPEEVCGVAAGVKEPCQPRGRIRASGTCGSMLWLGDAASFVASSAFNCVGTALPYPALNAGFLKVQQL